MGSMEERRQRLPFELDLGDKKRRKEEIYGSWCRWSLITSCRTLFVHEKQKINCTCFRRNLLVAFDLPMPFGNVCDCGSNRRTQCRLRLRHMSTTSRASRSRADQTKPDSIPSYAEHFESIWQSRNPLPLASWLSDEAVRPLSAPVFFVLLASTFRPGFPSILCAQSRWRRSSSSSYLTGTFFSPPRLW